MMKLSSVVAVTLCVIHGSTALEQNQQCSTNEVYSHGAENTCSNIIECRRAYQNGAFWSYPECICKEDHARDEDDNCIPVWKCHQIAHEKKYGNTTLEQDQQCSTNEVYSAGVENSCSDVVKCRIAYPNGAFLYDPECICKKNHARDEDDNCIPVWKCHQIAHQKKYGDKSNR